MMTNIQEYVDQKKEKEKKKKRKIVPKKNLHFVIDTNVDVTGKESLL